MVGNKRRKFNNEDGAVSIMEATFVFPIMFIVLIFLIYMGNAFYIKTQIDGIVVDKAIKGASYCADPMLEIIEETGAIPSLSNLDIKPYRYLFGGMDDIEVSIGREVKESIEGTYVSFFRNMKPQILSDSGNIAKFNNYLAYSTFSVDAQCKIDFPVKMLGSDEAFSITLNVRSEVAVNDTTEFIRNVDMAIDYFEDNPVVEKIRGIFEKVNEFMQSFASR